MARDFIFLDCLPEGQSEWGWGWVGLIGCSPKIHGALGLVPQHHTQPDVIHNFSPRSLDIEAGVSEG